MDLSHDCLGDAGALMRAVSNSELFSGLTGTECTALATRLRPRHFVPGEILLHPGPVQRRIAPHPDRDGSCLSQRQSGSSQRTCAVWDRGNSSARCRCLPGSRTRRQSWRLWRPSRSSSRAMTSLPCSEAHLAWPRISPACSACVSRTQTSSAPIPTELSSSRSLVQSCRLAVRYWPSIWRSAWPCIRDAGPSWQPMQLPFSGHLNKRQSLRWSR